MTTFSNIRGKLIRTLDNDPTVPPDGEIWYNKTLGVLRIVEPLEAWISSAPINTGRYLGGGAGTQTAGIIAGGEGPTFFAKTEEYNGSGWSEGGDMNTARQNLGLLGTQTAALAFGGRTNVAPVLSATEEYDGSTWTTSPGSLNTARQDVPGAGTQTAGLAAGGNSAFPGNTQVTNTEEYDGTSWAAGGALNNAISSQAVMGTQTAGLSALGTSNGTAVPTGAEEYDGSAWTSVNPTNTGRRLVAGAGLQTSAVVFGGFIPPASSATETYDGTSFTTSPATLATARNSLMGGGANGDAAFAAGGDEQPGISSLTEEYNRAPNSFVAAAWSSGGNYPATNEGLRGAGTQTAAFAGGGTQPSSNPTRTTATNNYDGSTWTSSGAVPYATGGQGYSGTQTAGLFFGGLALPFSMFTTTAEYDGSTWSSGGALPRGLYQMASSGTQTATLSTGGRSVPAATNYDEVNEYNGTSWSAETAYPTTVNGAHGTGPSTAALVFGGAPGVNTTFGYNGSTWTAGGNLNTGRHNGYPATAGSQTAALLAGGSVPPYSAATENYDGSTWATGPSLANAGASGAGAGTQAAALRVAGNTGTPSSPSNNTTEEFTEASNGPYNIRTLGTS